MVGIYWVYQSVYPLLKGGVKQLGALHPKGTTIFPMIRAKGRTHDAQAAWRPSNAAVKLRLNTAVWRCMPPSVTWGQMVLGLVKKGVIISYAKMRKVYYILT